MLTFTLRRVLTSLLVLLASSLLVFALCAASFDPLARYRRQQPPPTEAYLEAVRARLGLDDPFLVRYWNWLSGVLSGDFGRTLDGTPVADQLVDRLLVTGRMVIPAIVLAIVLAVVVGVVGAVRQYRPVDHVSTFVAYLLIAMPVFWFAALLKEFVAGGINDLLGRRVLYTIGEQTPGLELYASGAEIWVDRLGHLVLPTLCLALVSFAAWSRFQRSAMLDVLGSDYLQFARAKGLTYRRAVVRHGLRNALLPLTTVVALSIGTLFGGAIITESVFVWHGMGEYLLEDGVRSNDINVVLGWLLVSAAFVVLANLVADFLYAVLDPRIRLA